VRKREDTERRPGEESDRELDRPTALAFVTVGGAVTEDPAQAVAGEIVELDEQGRPAKRTWFLMEEVQIKWLPVRELAFLLWVLVLLVLVWVGVALFLKLS
jgi:hypothetical protein